LDLDYVWRINLTLQNILKNMFVNLSSFAKTKNQDLLQEIWLLSMSISHW